MSYGGEMIRLIRCERCKQKFEHFTPVAAISKKRFCDDCQLEKQRICQDKRYRRKK